MPPKEGQGTTALYRKQGGIATIMFNRPGRLNALTKEMVIETTNLLERAEEEKTVRAVILTGAGSSFCAGEDLREDLIEYTPLEFREKILAYQALTRTIHNMKKVVLAEVNGYALGGGAEIAISCDIVYASEGAKFGFPEVKVAQLITNAGFHRLPRLVGEKKAKEIALTGETMSAAEAERIGLINRVFPQRELHGAVIETARRIMANAPLSVMLTKSLIDRGLDTDFETAMSLETESITAIYSSEDRKEGAAAFSGKRGPTYRGR
ncbi:MAG: enoyl-CoA hydratase-related protein [Thaumarchaeota archaeon]|nr:enoyl-CoA hydratase-related protein [Nitrososphaerota archaeon]